MVASAQSWVGELNIKSQRGDLARY
jgi:hypothetical protein